MVDAWNTRATPKPADPTSDREAYNPTDDEMTRAFIDGWNARLDHDSFEMAVHYWNLASVTHVGAAPADPTSEAVERLTIADAWDILLNVDDRTSPEEYPDMCLITRDELERFMLAALATNAPEKVKG
jgi:hypothetical protein